MYTCIAWHSLEVGDISHNFPRGSTCCLLEATDKHKFTFSLCLRPFLPEVTSNCPVLTFRYARYEERKSKTAKHNIKAKVKNYVNKSFKCAECLTYKTFQIPCHRLLLVQFRTKLSSIHINLSVFFPYMYPLLSCNQYCLLNVLTCLNTPYLSIS